MSLRAFPAIPKDLREWTQWCRQALIDGQIETNELADASVTYPKLQDVSATDRVLGRATAGAGKVEELPCTAAGRALIDDANAAAQRTTLGLGTAALKNTGASGDAVPVLDIANTWALAQTFSAPPRVPIHTVSGVPSATPPAQIIYVSDESGGAVLAFSTGSDWRRVTDRAVVT